MKKNAILLLILALATTGYSQIASPNSPAGGPTVLSSLVPQYCQGSSTTNNNRVPVWFWVELTGLQLNATYRYHTALDTLNTAPTSNGAGNPYLINTTSGTIRRILNPSMTSNTGYDSLVASSNGTYAGWFAVEPTGNGRFVAGTILYPKIMLNNGAGGSTVMYRILVPNDSIMVINFGATNSALEGTALYDSLPSTPKNFICLYDNVASNGRPISIAISEDDGLSLSGVTSIAAFYRNNVDSLSMHWGTIIPNNLANGVRSLEERNFATGAIVNATTDADGWWCSGTNTANMTGGNAGSYLNSTFTLSSSASIPDTVWANLSANFNATSNAPNATYTWDYGDATAGTGATTSHTYTTSGIVSVSVIISTGGCSDTIWHNVVVLLGSSIPRHITLGFEIFPNPSSGVFNINAKNDAEKEIEVYNVLGETVYTSTFTGTSYTADLTSLQKGVYFMRIRDISAGGKTGTKRIIIE